MLGKIVLGRIGMSGQMMGWVRAGMVRGYKIGVRSGWLLG